MFRQLLGAMLLVAASLTAIPALAAMSAVNPALMQNPDSRPKKVVLLPPQVFVYELSTGGVPSRKIDWEATARNNLSSAAIRLAREAGMFEVIPAPDPAPAVQEQLDAHIGLYDRVADSVFVYGRGDKSAWAHKKNEFDYTIGPGLAFLREQTGADAALIVLGSDYISSGGRKAAFVVGLMVGVVMPLGQSFISAGIVDLETGDVQWMGFDASTSLDSRDAENVDALMRELYATWPGR